MISNDQLLMVVIGYHLNKSVFMFEDDQGDVVFVAGYQILSDMYSAEGLSIVPVKSISFTTSQDEIESWLWDDGLHKYLPMK